MDACDRTAGLDLLPAEARLSARALEAALADQTAAAAASVLDVRPRVQFGICALPGAQNLPLPELLAMDAEQVAAWWERSAGHPLAPGRIVAVCRRGNDSQLAAQHLAGLFPLAVFMDLAGGLLAWAREVDPTFPVY